MKALQEHCVAFADLFKSCFNGIMMFFLLEIMEIYKNVEDVKQIQHNVLYCLK